MVCRFQGHVKQKRVHTYSHNFLFFNVCTMFETVKGVHVTSRRELLGAFFTYSKTIVAGLAETRTKAKRLQTKNYEVVSGGSQRQNLGCELWVAAKYLVV